MTYIQLSFVALLAACPGAALACPTGADLNGAGIVFVVDGGEEVHRRVPNGLIEIQTAPDADGISGRQVLAHGVHVIHLSDWQNGAMVPDSAWRFAFATSVTDLPAPVAGETFTARTTVLDGLGGDREVINHRWGVIEPYQVGQCTFDAIPVRADYDGDDYDHVENLVYFPDLGTAILLSYGDDEGTDTYTYTDVWAK